MNNLINPELQSLASQALGGYLDQVKVAEEKQAFIPQGDPSLGGGMPPGGDPAAMGGMPPGGAPPMDPAMMGGAPPMDPAMMGGAPPMPPAAPPAAPGAEPIKPKIDVNVEIMQIKNLLAKITDALGISVPAQDMTATPEKLTQMAQGGDPSAAGGAPAGDPSAIQPPSPIDPMAAASPEKAGHVVSDRTGFNSVDTAGLAKTANRASAIAAIRGGRNGFAA